MPTMMVTGSHIPDDRNGIKFNLPSGEILKDDEEGIRAQDVPLPGRDVRCRWRSGRARAAAAGGARRLSMPTWRFLDFFPPLPAGMRIGLYEHSSVAREAFYAVLTGLGAEVTSARLLRDLHPGGYRGDPPEDVALAGTGPRRALRCAGLRRRRRRPPAGGDEHGRWLRGDIAGILCARELGAAAVVTPVSSNTAWSAAAGSTRCCAPASARPTSSPACRLQRPRHRAGGGLRGQRRFLIDTDIERDGRACRRCRPATR
jgi:phosphomannomutase